jgi:hypothetical protein
MSVTNEQIIDKLKKFMTLSNDPEGLKYDIISVLDCRDMVLDRMAKDINDSIDTKLEYMKKYIQGEFDKRQHSENKFMAIMVEKFEAFKSMIVEKYDRLINTGFKYFLIAIVLFIIAIYTDGNISSILVDVTFSLLGSVVFNPIGSAVTTALATIIALVKRKSLMKFLRSKARTLKARLLRLRRSSSKETE